MGDWTSAWDAWTERFDPFHVPAGHPTGGQFTTSSGAGSGTKTAKSGKVRKGGNAPYVGPPIPERLTKGDLARRRVLEEKIHADEAKIRQLEHQLHLAVQAAKSAASTAAHAKAAAAAAKKAGHHKKAAAHASAHKRHYTRHVTHQRSISALRQRIHDLRMQVRQLRAQVARI